MLRVPDTLVPLIFMLNGPHLWNVAGDKKTWSVYMTFGNVSSKIRQMTSMRSVVMVALLPIPIMNWNVPQQWLHEQRQRNTQVLKDVIQQILHPFTLKQNPHTKSGN